MKAIPSKEIQRPCETAAATFLDTTIRGVTVQAKTRVKGKEQDRTVNEISRENAVPDTLAELRNTRGSRKAEQTQI